MKPNPIVVDNPTHAETLAKVGLIGVGAIALGDHVLNNGNLRKFLLKKLSDYLSGKK